MRVQRAIRPEPSADDYRSSLTSTATSPDGGNPLGPRDELVAAGDHIAYFWETPKDFREGVGFLDVGLERGDFCVIFGHADANGRVREVLAERGVRRVAPAESGHAGDRRWSDNGRNLKWHAIAWRLRIGTFRPGFRRRGNELCRRVPKYSFGSKAIRLCEVTFRTPDVHRDEETKCAKTWSEQTHTTVTLSVSGSADRVIIDVQDECGGLPGAVDAEELSPSFAQQGADRTGLGIGLAFSRWGAEANGGRLYARNLSERGCVFTVDLPRCTRSGVARLRLGVTCEPALLSCCAL